MELAGFSEFGDGFVVLEAADAGIRRNLTPARSSNATAISDHMPASKKDLYEIAFVEFFY